MMATVSFNLFQFMEPSPGQETEELLALFKVPDYFCKVPRQVGMKIMNGKRSRKKMLVMANLSSAFDYIDISRI